MPRRNNSILPNVSLATANFTPATFEGNVFTPQQVDMNLLARSLSNIENREEKLANQRLALNEAFSKARELLPDNAETNQYITDNQNRIKDNIDAMINIGDMSGALTSAKNLAGDFISSPEYNARVKEHRQRKEWLESLDRIGVDNYIKEYYRDTYQDKNNFTRDANGNITGTAGWEAPLPEQGQSSTSIIEEALKTVKDERTDRAGDSSVTNADRSGSSSHSAYRREFLSADKISSTAMSIVNNNPRIRQAFIDQFNAGIHQINKLKSQLRTETDTARRESIQNQISGYENMFYKNGSPLSTADAYINNLFSPDNSTIKNAAYDYQHTNSGGSSTAAPLGSGNPRGNSYDMDAEVLEGKTDYHSPGANSTVRAGTIDAPSRGNRSNLMRNQTFKPEGNTWTK